MHFKNNGIIPQLLIGQSGKLDLYRMASQFIIELPPLRSIRARTPL